MVKFEDAFWRSLLGVFWSIFGEFFIIFWYCPRVKNRVIYNVFVPLASKKSF